MRARAERHTRAVRRCLQGPELHAAIARVLADHLDPSSHRAWIIGSEATGRALPGGDIDVALEGSERFDLAALARLRAALEALPTLRPIDLVDLRRASEHFRRTALQHAIPLPLERDRARDVQV